MPKLSPERKKALISLMRKAHVLGRQENHLLGLDIFYQLECIDPKHRDKTALNMKFEEWRNLESSSENNSFWQWLENTYPAFTMKQGVTYLNKDERKAYKLKVIDKYIFQGDSKIPYDTTKFSGKLPGYAAYVMDKNGTIYIGEHKTGIMHHSSFLAGAPVISAGMIKVECGKVVEINHHSGHYIPKEENLNNFLLKVDRNIFSDKAKIKFSSNDRSKTLREYADFLINIRANEQYNWLPNRISILLTIIGKYIKCINEKKISYSAKDYYDNKLNKISYEIIPQKGDNDLEKGISSPSFIIK